MSLAGRPHILCQCTVQFKVACPEVCISLVGSCIALLLVVTMLQLMYLDLVIHLSRVLSWQRLCRGYIAAPAVRVQLS